MIIHAKKLSVMIDVKSIQTTQKVEGGMELGSPPSGQTHAQPLITIVFLYLAYYTF